MALTAAAAMVEEVGALVEEARVAMTEASAEVAKGAVRQVGERLVGSMGAMVEAAEETVAEVAMARARAGRGVVAVMVKEATARVVSG